MEDVTDEAGDMHIAHCGDCGCKMDISAVEPYTKVVCPDCDHQTRVKCELGQYRLIGRYAAGGMSMVFKALDVILDREVAIKILNENYSRDEKRMKQFEHEAMITAAISDPHVVRVYTVGQAYGHFYIAMEMVPGENLEQMISREDVIGEETMLPIAGEIIAGLRAAKQAGLIHRDMKPGNILFDSNGHVKIVDFGLALVTQGGTATADEIWATPYYVPPEALDGEEEDFRSDMYALGATLYHALSGQPPIPDEAKSSRAVRKAKENIKPLAKVAPWLTAETCHLVDRAMALKREDRFDSYAEMEDVRALAYEVIEREGAGEPIHSRERARRRAMAKKKTMIMAAAGLAAVLIMIAVVVKFGSGADDAPEGAGIMDTADGQMYTNDDGQYSPEVAARIGKRFHLSHKMLREGRYDDAKAVFVKLMNDQDLTEPAASWAGVEAVVASWLAGDTGDARKAMIELRQHMEKRGVSKDSGVTILLNQLASLGTVRGRDVDSNTMKMVHMMAVALKNWETGSWDEAVPMFEKIGDKQLPEGSPLGVYREIAKRYLADFEKLEPIASLPAPADIRSANEQLSVIQGALKGLKTKGRADFHVKVWQARLQKRIEMLKREAEVVEEKVYKVPTYEQELSKFHQLTSKAQFGDASRLLRGVKPGNDRQHDRDAWIYLSDSAAAFLSGIEGVVPDSGIDMTLECVDGRTFQRILGAKRGGLQLQGLQGKEGGVFVRWAMISPDSVLAIHQKINKQPLATLEGQLRTEQAICYAWLTGMKEKAKLAAGKLSAVNGNFHKTWTSAMRAQGQKP